MSNMPKSMKFKSDAVAERRLRPLYEYLDNGNNKKALHEAERLIKKQPDFRCAKVLKALALLRMGKVEECEEIVESVKKELPIEDSTLQAMTICYRETQKLERICEIYETAVSKDPLNEEFNTHLFMAYVRVADYKKQHAVSLNLYKLFPKNPYYFWAVMSLIMQAQEAAENIAKKVHLPLAERMVKKMVDEDKLNAEQETHLYVMILEMMNKYEEALKVVEKHLRKNQMECLTLSAKRLSLLYRVESWKKLNIKLKKILLEEPDSYGNYVMYVDTVIKLMAQKQANEEKLLCDIFDNMQVNSQDGILSDDDDDDSSNSDSNGLQIHYDDTIELCVEFIHRCKKASDRLKCKLRGPYLALIVLFKKLEEIGINATSYLGDVEDLFFAYFQEFGDRSCFLKDLTTFLPIVNDRGEKLLSMTSEYIKVVRNSFSLTKKTLMMQASHYQLMRYFDAYRTQNIEERMHHVQDLIAHYFEGEVFLPPERTSQDLGFNDVFMMLAAHTLYDVFLETKNYNVIKDAIVLTEYAYGSSSSNSYFKLLLLRFYNILGATKAGNDHYQRLDVKHMQYDSMGYLQCWSLLSTGQYSLAREIISHTIKFFHVNHKDIADQLTFAYKYGSFEKIKEIVEFRDRLKNSYHYKACQVENIILEVFDSDSHSEVMNTVQQLNINSDNEIFSKNDNLVDNRDVNVMLVYDPPCRRITEDYLKLTFNDDVRLINIRSSMLRCLEACLNVERNAFKDHRKNSKIPKNGLTNNDNINGINGHMEQMDSLLCLDELLKVIENMMETYRDILRTPATEIPLEILTGLESSRLLYYLTNKDYFPLFMDTLNFAHAYCCFCINNSSSYKEIQDFAQLAIEKFNSIVTETVEKTTDPDREMLKRDNFHLITLAVEVSCVMCLITGVINSILSALCKTIDPPSKKKKRKIPNKEENVSKEGKEEVVTTSNDKSSQKKEEVVNLYEYFSTNVSNNITMLDKHLHYLLSTWLCNIKEGGSDSSSSSYMVKYVFTDTFDCPMKINFSKILPCIDECVRGSCKSSLKQFKAITDSKIRYISKLNKNFKR